MSGIDCALSHLETDWRLTFSRSASSSCDQPAFLRRAMSLSENVMMCLLLGSLMAIVGAHSICARQRLPTLRADMESAPTGFGNFLTLSYQIPRLRTIQLPHQSVNRGLRLRADASRFPLHRCFLKTHSPCRTAPSRRTRGRPTAGWGGRIPAPAPGDGRQPC